MPGQSTPGQKARPKGLAGCSRLARMCFVRGTRSSCISSLLAIEDVPRQNLSAFVLRRHVKPDT
eukprot:scaffold117643_cov19-Tisochrysis_lutea.AAC.1